MMYTNGNGQLLLDSFVVFFSFFPAVPVRLNIITDTRRSVVLFDSQQQQGNEPGRHKKESR
jgi:hypothetical protein